MFIQQLTTLIRRSTRTSECQLVPYTGSIAGHICVLAGGGEDAVCREAAIRRRDLHRGTCWGRSLVASLSRGPAGIRRECCMAFPGHPPPSLDGPSQSRLPLGARRCGGSQFPVPAVLQDRVGGRPAEAGDAVATLAHG